MTTTKFVLFATAFAAVLHAGMRDDEMKAKAKGHCGPDRDPENLCRLSSESSLIETEQPTFQWTGVSIDENQNFCARMTPILGDYTDMSVASCTSQGAGTACTNHYEHITGGSSGDIAHCREGSSGCEAGAVHNCTWSFYMEDLISKHSDSQDNCAAKLLEAKRSLDGLLHSVQDVYNQLMQWNAIVQAENSTIRGLLEDQQNDWDDYVSEQQSCDSMYSSDTNNLQNIQNEMTELRAIANPDVRSAVDVRRARGYQSSGTTSESCPADYPYVNTAQTSYCCTSTDAAAAATLDTTLCSQRNCQDATGAAVACVNNARADDSGMLSPSQTAAAAAASFAEMGEEACQSFSSLVERVQKKHGKKIMLKQPSACDSARTALEADFKNAFLALGKLYNEEIFTMEQNRSICLNEATYNYKAGVEGIDGIDDQIQDAAGKIHEAQGEIARLEPMLHDVERAVNRMRTYVETITTECGTEEYIGHLYKDIQEKIIALQECPGRNDFIIDVPHWRPKRQIGQPTPAPTPWYQDPKAEAVRSVL